MYLIYIYFRYFAKEIFLKNYFTESYLSTGDWMCPVNKGDDKKKKDTNKDEEECNEPKGDPEMAPIYLKRLLPVFAQTFQQTMLPSIR